MLYKFPQLSSVFLASETLDSAGWGSTNSNGLAHKPKLLLDGLEGCDLAGRAICAEQVPGVESGEVLDSSKNLITTNCRRDKL